MRFLTMLLVPVLSIGFSSAALAESLVTGLDGAGGYGALSHGANDDRSSNTLRLPFTLNFFGHSYNSFYVNNNGNITFNVPVYQYAPTAFESKSEPPRMILRVSPDIDRKAGFGLKLSTGTELRLPVERCGTKVCEGSGRPVPSVRARRARAPMAQVALRLSDGKQLIVPINLREFSRALAIVERGQDTKLAA